MGQAFTTPQRVQRAKDMLQEALRRTEQTQLSAREGQSSATEVHDAAKAAARRRRWREPKQVVRISPEKRAVQVGLSAREGVSFVPATEVHDAVKDAAIRRRWRQLRQAVRLSQERGAKRRLQNAARYGFGVDMNIPWAIDETIADVSNRIKENQLKIYTVPLVNGRRAHGQERIGLKRN